MPNLSIITINYNNAEGLKKTFESVFGQSFKDLEYLVIDGGSTDNSNQFIEEHADKISYWVSEQDTGVYNAMNKGIKKAKGDYLLVLNSGDHFFNTTILAEIKEHLDGTDIVYGNIFFIEPGVKSWLGVYPDKLTFQHFIEGSLPHPSTFIKRTLFQKVGYYDENLKITGDWKFFLNSICRYNASYKHIDKTIAVFYHDGLSSVAKNQQIITKEKESVLSNDFALFIDNSKELISLREFKNNKVIEKMTKAAKFFGLLKRI